MTSDEIRVKYGYIHVGTFYGGLAQVRDSAGMWFHVKPDGTPAYKERYDWVDDFSQGVAFVGNGEQRFRIRADGTKVS